MNTFKYRVVFLVVLFFIISGFVIRWAHHVPHSEGYDYETKIVRSHLTDQAVTVAATIEAQDQVSLYPLTDGVVTKVYVKPGQKVKAGESLVALDLDEEARKLYNRIKKTDQDLLSEASIKKELNRIKDYEEQSYYHSGEALKERIDVIRSMREWTQLVNNMSELKLKLSSKILRAPYDGFVTEVNWKVGDVVLANRKETPGVSVAKSLDHFVAHLEITDDLIPLVQKQAKVIFKLPFVTQKTFTGEVTSVSYQAYKDDKNRYYKAIANINSDNSLDLRFGMRVFANITTTQQDEGVWIPNEAFSIEIPNELVHQNLSYVAHQRGYASRTTLNQSKDVQDTSHQTQKQSLASPVNRLVASETRQKDSLNIRSLFLLNSSNQVIRVEVEAQQLSHRYTFVPTKSLENSRVIVYYYPNKELLKTKMVEQ
jgi:RND family efflux transporter MFP subunit